MRRPELTTKQRARGFNLPSASTPDRHVQQPRILAVSSCPAHPGGAPEAHPWPDPRGPPRATPCDPAAGHSPSPAARPHIVDDHGLVSDDVVGLHGPAEPALPSRRAAGGPAGYKARGETWTDATPDTAPLPSPSALPTRTRPRSQSQVPTEEETGTNFRRD